MKKVIFVVIISLLLGCAKPYIKPDEGLAESFDLEPGKILLVVRSNFSRYTGYFPYECDPENCVPFYFWFVHEAKVLDVLYGAYSSDQITFANLQHTNYIKKVTNEWYVLLDTFENTETIDKLESRYYVVKHKSSYLERGN